MLSFAFVSVIYGMFNKWSETEKSLSYKKSEF